MAKRRNYIPTAEGDLKTWLMNLRDKIDTHGSTIGLTGSEINSIKSNVNQLISKIDAVEQKRNDFHEAVADKNTFKNATTKSIGTLISRGKLTSGYTTAIGEDLDVIGEEITIDSGTAKPIITSKKVPGGWEFSFNLLNFFHGIKLYRKRPAETEFKRIATDTNSPYVDADPQVNNTEYHAFYINTEEEEVGVRSDIIKINL